MPWCKATWTARYERIPSAHHAEQTIAQLIEERNALDCRPAQPERPQAAGAATVEALKHRADLLRLIARAEAERVRRRKGAPTRLIAASAN